MRVGYARVSTGDQNIQAQLERLSDCERVFQEKLSGSKRDREALAECLDFVRAGDTLVAVRLDRLARSVAHLCAIADTLQRKGVALVVLDQAINTTTPTGKLLFHVLGAIAEFELGVRREAQRAGIEYARQHGKPSGRKPSLTAEQVAIIRAESVSRATVGSLARQMRVSKSTIYRALRGGVSYDAGLGDSPL